MCWSGGAVTRHSCRSSSRQNPISTCTCVQVCGEQSTLRQRYEGALESKTQTISDLRRELKEARKAAGQVRNRSARQRDSRAGARTVCCGRHTSRQTCGTLLSPPRDGV